MSIQKAIAILFESENHLRPLGRDEVGLGMSCYGCLRPIDGSELRNPGWYAMHIDFDYPDLEVGSKSRIGDAWFCPECSKELKAGRSVRDLHRMKNLDVS